MEDVITCIKPPHLMEGVLLRDPIFMSYFRSPTKYDNYRMTTLKVREDKRTDKEKMWDALSKPIHSDWLSDLDINSLYATVMKLTKDYENEKDV